MSRAVAHLFVCHHGRLLPRWKEAFGSAHAALPSTRRPNKGDKIDLLWLRLEFGRPVADQLRTVMAQFDSVPFVVMSDLPSDEEALSIFAVGARGYCNTHAAPSLLRQISDVVLQGGLWIGESLMQRLVTATTKVSAPVENVAQIASWRQNLTDREFEVAQTLASGASNKEIARALGITDRTVKAHVGAIFEKLQVRDRLQLSLLINGRLGPRDNSSV